MMEEQSHKFELLPKRHDTFWAIHKCLKEYFSGLTDANSHFYTKQEGTDDRRIIIDDLAVEILESLDPIEEKYKATS